MNPPSKLYVCPEQLALGLKGRGELGDHRPGVRDTAASLEDVSPERGRGRRAGQDAPHRHDRDGERAVAVTPRAGRGRRRRRVGGERSGAEPGRGALCENVVEAVDDTASRDERVMDFEIALVGEDSADELAEHSACPALDEYPRTHLADPAHRIREGERPDEMGSQQLGEVRRFTEQVDRDLE